MSKSVPVHAHAMMFAFKLIHLGLLVGRECLVKRSLCLGVCRDHLRGEVADCIGSLFNSGGVVLLNGRLQAVMSRTHLIMRCFGVVRCFAEDRARLLLLLGGQRQLLGQEVKVALRHLPGIGRIPLLRHGKNACQGQDCGCYFQEGCSHLGVLRECSL